MRHVNDGGAQALVQAFDLSSHISAQLCIQVGQRLVKQEDLGLAHDGSTDGHTLPLTTGQGGWLSIEQWPDLEQLCGVAHPFADLGLWRAAQPQTEFHVLPHRLVRVKRIVLKHHGNVSLSCRQVIDPDATNGYLALADRFKTRHHAQ